MNNWVWIQNANTIFTLKFSFIDLPIVNVSPLAGLFNNYVNLIDLTWRMNGS